MAKLIYSGVISLDGYLADKEGRFDWSVPDTEVHTFINAFERTIGTFLYGRRLYEVMVAWEAVDPDGDDIPETEREYARIWKAADKVVYSRTLDAPASERTRITRDFDPEGVRRLKETSDRDITVGGAELGAAALKAGVVDECHLYLSPVLVGGGTRWFPDDIFAKLRLADERRFGNGVVFLRYVLS
ncbi:dihydrofolate reductase family protein [Glycomyces sp. L485]|uniref:dihydrofolate reductase family protein n=1 Tax=Glycomyces sp. L485 TaxID=2909235 RepID=UPI001F4B5257|nr:dihydrofolate reductase family protein [Glycomyces sp. L485]MCH7232463.1 dihydrofolate reductase family protein [Glycomyces sp. L485]